MALGPSILANADSITAAQTGSTTSTTITDPATGATVTTTIQTTTVEPSKTYKIDWDSGEIYSQWVDNIDAVKQAAVKAILTLRDKYPIYSSDVGSEIGYMMGQAFSDKYLNAEIPRLVSEALAVDDRIQEASSFTITRADNGQFNISFTLITNLGESTTVEVTV